MRLLDLLGLPGLQRGRGDSVKRDSLMGGPCIGGWSMQWDENPDGVRGSQRDGEGGMGEIERGNADLWTPTPKDQARAT